MNNINRIRINIGCGQTPIKGWRNFDNSMSLRLARFPILPYFLRKVGFLVASQYHFIKFLRSNQIEYGDATKRLPFTNGSVDVLYSSNMIGYLDQAEVALFLKEARRILRSGGIIRLADVDLSKLVQQYIESGDADAFISATRLSYPRPRTIAQRLKFFILGPKTGQYQWTYDGKSLCRLLLIHGFVNATILQPGETTIQEPDTLNLFERDRGSMYVEAVNP